MNGGTLLLKKKANNTFWIEMQELIWGGGETAISLFPLSLKNTSPLKKMLCVSRFFFFKHESSQSKEKLPNQDLAWIFSQ